MEMAKEHSSLLGRAALALVLALTLSAVAVIAQATAGVQPAYAAEAGWKQVGDKWQYIDESGSIVKGEEEFINGKWYQFDNQGWMVTGWWRGSHVIDTSGARAACWKYYNASGDMARVTWKKLNGKWYYFDTDGEMVENGWRWVPVSDDWDGEWEYYYFDKSGAWSTNCWVPCRYREELWNYLDGSGVPVSGWKKIGNNWYRFRAEGDEGSRLQPGETALVGWWKVNGEWYYFNNSCAMTTGWQKVGGSWYYLKSSGAMATGWQKVGGSWYYLNSSGAMATGWQKAGNSWYYLNGSGVMQANKWIGNYYVTSSGAMATNTWIGKYHVNGSGLWDATR